MAKPGSEEIPTGKLHISTGHSTAPCRRCHRQTMGEQNLCVVTLTSAAYTSVLVHYSVCLAVALCIGKIKRASEEKEDVSKAVLFAGGVRKDRR